MPCDDARRSTVESRPRFWWFCALALAGVSKADDVVVSLATADFDAHLRDNQHSLIQFYAPWCGHCKKLKPEFEKAALDLRPQGVILAIVDATKETQLASDHEIKGYPTMLWFDTAKKYEYDGGRTSENIVEWVTSMIGVAVIETEAPDDPADDKPRIVLYADSLLPGFEAAAMANRRKASWYLVKTPGPKKVALTHRGEEAIELADMEFKEESVTKFLDDNAMPLFGLLDADSFSRYVDSGKGLVWSLFPLENGTIDEMIAKYRPMMVEVAKKVKDKYFVVYADVNKYSDAIESMLEITKFPAIAVQAKAGDKRKFILKDEITQSSIEQFMEDIAQEKIEPQLKSEPIPTLPTEAISAKPGGVPSIVGYTLTKEVFMEDRDVLLEIYAPWCGHCKKLEPEYVKVARKVQKEQVGDILKIVRMDGTVNDSPHDAISWDGFPTLFFVKANTSEPMKYEGDRTAKAIWQYIKKNSSRAQEIKARMEQRKENTHNVEL